jgi:hypothetical protein
MATYGLSPALLETAAARERAAEDDEAIVVRRAYEAGRQRVLAFARAAADDLHQRLDITRDRLPPDLEAEATRRLEEVDRRLAELAPLGA